MRVPTASTFRRVLMGLRMHQSATIRAQEQLSTGRRILRPSDDPSGTARAIQLERQLADVGRFRESIAGGSRLLDAASFALSETSGHLIEARELIVQALNGTLSDGDRRSIAAEIDVLREELLDRANHRSGDHYVFGGTGVGEAPWQEVVVNGRTQVVYVGDDEAVQARISHHVTTALTLSGTDVFGGWDPAGTVYSGLTGVASGTTVDEGEGYAYLELRHDATDPGALASVGVALVAGGANDTLLGDHTLVIDSTAGTVQLGDGPAVTIPDPLPADLVVANGLGGELHLDLTAYSGADFSGTVTGEGSISLDGSTFVAIDFTETDLELIDEATGTTLHVDTTAVGRAGVERVAFAGTTNVFDVLGAIADDLRNEDGLDGEAVIARLQKQLVELDRHHEDVLDAIGVVGARGQRMRSADGRVGDVELQLEGMLSSVRDADLAETAAELTRSEYMLQIAQASGARLLQTSLVNYL